MTHPTPQNRALADIAACRGALRKQPGNTALQLKLADLLHQSGQSEQALTVYQQILEKHPQLQPARDGQRKLLQHYLNLARSQKKQGHAQAALAAYRTCLATLPDHAPWHVELGAYLYELKQANEAMRHWRRALQLDPAQAGASHNLGVALRQRKQFDASIAAFRRALAVDPGYAGSCNSLTNLLTERGRYQEAEEVCNAFLARQPDHPEIVASLAKVHERQGHIQAAYDLLLPLLQNGVRTPELVIAFGTVCHRLKPPSDLAIPYLKELLTHADLDKNDRIKALTTLAQLCDAQDRFEEAFAYLKQGRDLAPADAKAIRQRFAYIDTLRGTYTRERLDALPHATLRSELPIFIVGMPRSGTTLTEQILAAHPLAHGAGELTHVGATAVNGFGTGKPLPECLDLLTQEQVDAQAGKILDHLRQLSPGAARVVDKMPLNFLHLGAIELLLPGARIIHCTRHPLDICISIYFNEFAAGLPYTRNLTALGQYYRRYVALMEHWQATVKLPIFTMNYEALVADPEPHIRALLEFCGLDWDDRCLRFSEKRRHVDTPSYHQVRQPIYTRSVARYKSYRPWLGELVTALGDTLSEEPAH